MSVLISWRRIVLMAMLCLLPVGMAQAAPEILPVSEITTGMKGIAKTVVNGTQIEEFGVEVLGIMKNKGPSGDLILVRTFGDLIDRTGGIAQGMSGSPVYIDGKLVGAVAYGWSLTDHKIGMVTPIADMLKLWDLPSGSAPPSDELFLQAPDSQPVATPLMASGFSEQALQMLQKQLQPYNLIPYAVGDAPAGLTFAKLEPGSSVGVELVRGDISLGALGTVTYTEGDKVLAFGHPFLKKGNAGYFMSNAYIFTTVNGLENSFKVGTVGQAVGAIQQDRGAGIAGQLDHYPGIVPLRITVADSTIGRTQEAAVQVIRDEQLAPILAATSVFNIMEKTSDRVGPGTAKVSFEIMAPDMPEGVLKRDNMFYSPTNIGEQAVAEIHEALSVLASNQFNAVDIMDVKVNVEVDDSRRTAAIIEASAAKPEASPGEVVNIAVKLKPFRGEPVTRMVPFTVPKDSKPGPMLLEVRGGGMVSLTSLLLKMQGLDELLLKPVKSKQKSLQEVVKELQDRDRNNDIVVEPIDPEQDPLLAPPDPQLDNTRKKSVAPKSTEGKTLSGANKSAGKLLGKAEDAKPAKAHLTIDYIIDNGDLQVPLMVTASNH